MNFSTFFQKKSVKRLPVQKLVVPLQSEINKMVSFFDSVAQLVEQLTLNQWVEGSSPSGVTKQSNRMTINVVRLLCFIPFSTLSLIRPAAG